MRPFCHQGPAPPVPCRAARKRPAGADTGRRARAEAAVRRVTGGIGEASVAVRSTVNSNRLGFWHVFVNKCPSVVALWKGSALRAWFAARVRPVP